MRKIACLFVLGIVSAQVFSALGLIAATLLATALGAKWGTINHVTALPMTYIGSPVPSLLARLLPGILVQTLYLACAVLVIRRLLMHYRDRSILPPPSYSKASAFLAMSSLCLFVMVMLIMTFTFVFHLYGVMIIGGLLLGVAQLCNTLSFFITEIGDVARKTPTVQRASGDVV